MADDAPSKPEVFLSYAREDEARARELATALDQRGFSVFWDHEVPPGQTWHSDIGEALANARCVVVAWSSHSIASQWVLEEASEGKDRNVLVPVLFEAVPPPFGFRAIQAANLVDWRPGRPSPAFDSLLGAVERIVAGQAGSGTGAEVAASSEAAPKTKPSARPSRLPPAPSERRRESVKHPNGRGGGSPRRIVLAALAGLVTMAGAGGAAVFWWRMQTGPATSAPGQSSAPESASSKRKDVWTSPGVEKKVTWTSPGTGVAGEEMRDCPECPEMVLVPAGEFTMGSPPDEPGRDDDEGPQRKVTIAEPFWVGKNEVTFAEWGACHDGEGCSYNPEDEWGRGNQPVMRISWYDAQEYAAWLGKKTGKSYRLLSEAEWEYVARAVTKTAYWWGRDVGSGNANCEGCGSEWDGTKTASVGSFKANDFGLHDTAGNVWEWVQDCYHDSYDGAPRDGSAWKDGVDCSRVRRGGSWSDASGSVRSANRYWNDPGGRSSYIGFRVARAPD